MRVLEQLHIDYMKIENGTVTNPGAGSNATIQQMRDDGAAGKFGRSLDFDGTDDYVAVRNLGSVANSVSVWVKPSSTTQKILELSDTAYLEISSGTVSATGFTSPTIYVDGLPRTTLPDTNWHHILVTSSTAVNTSATNIGKQGTNYYTGQIDDVRIYNYPLTATQVKKVYNEGSAVRFGPSSGLP